MNHVQISEEDLPESQNNTTDETIPLNMIGEESVGLPDDEVSLYLLIIYLNDYNYIRSL